VGVADDPPLFREAVGRAVRERPECERVGEAADGRAALELIRARRPDVAVLDAQMPHLDQAPCVPADTALMLLGAVEDGEIR